MNMYKFFQFAVVTLAIGSGVVLAQAVVEGGDVSIDAMTIDQINARIGSLEGEMIQAVANRDKQKRQAEFEDENASPLRVESKKVEKQLLDQRTAFDTRVRLLDPEIRRLEGNLKRHHEEIKDYNGLMAAMDREIKFAESATNGAAGQIAGLNAEVDTNREMIKQVQTAIDQLNTELADRKKNVAETDAEAGRLAAQIKELDEKHRQILSEMNSVIDDKVEIKQVDDNRHAIMAELQKLRARRTQLTESSASGK